MMQITSKNFNKRRMKIDVQYGKNIQASPKTKEEHIAEALYERFKATKKVEIHMDFKLGNCAICESKWMTGHFAIEKLMLVPVKAGGNQQNVTVTIPRVVCPTCSKTMSDEDEQHPEQSATSSTLGTAWRVHTEFMDSRRPQPRSRPVSQPVSRTGSRGPTPQGSRGPTPQASPNLRPANNMRPTFKSKLQGGARQKGPALARSPPVRNAGRANSAGNMRPSPQLSSAALSTATDGVDALSIGDACQSTVSSSPGDNATVTQSAVNKAGFLVCTQLVKTGGADKAGLQVGDIFARLGHMNKDNFKDLKDVANFIRRSANQHIEAVVLRKQAGSDRPGGRGAVFHTIKLQLTPLHSHDADDGGVLGAVMNLWPKPEPRHSGNTHVGG